MQLFAFSLVLFRSQSLGDAVTIFRHMFGAAGEHAGALRWDNQWGVPLLLTLLGHVLVYRQPLDATLRRYPHWVVPVLYGAAILGIMIYGAAGNEFIYFQF